MHSDPMPYILFAALLGAAIGFFGCALFASNKIRRANLAGFREGLDHARRSSSQPSTLNSQTTITPDGWAHYSPTERGLQSARH